MAIEVDNLFEALDIIIKQRMEDISYDKTEICTIVDASNAKNGRYWVSPNGGQTRYEAYSESDEYKKDESVRVSILNGDFTQKKFITGKYVVDDAITPMTYVSPLNTVIDVSGNIVGDTKFNHQFSLKTNDTRREIPIWSADLDLDESYRDLQASGIYNTIALSAHFRTLLDNYDMRSGSYGLRLDIYVKVAPESDKYIVRSVTLDSSEMFGNPYGFVLYSPQAKKFDLSKIGTVEKMVLWYYQNGDFSYYNLDDRKTISINADEVYQDNLLMRNVKVAFGSDISVVTDNTIQAYSADAINYRLNPAPETNEKRIGFLWYNKDGDNNYLGFSDGIVDFETDAKGEIIYTNKLDKSWNHATKDVVDESGRVVLEFAKDSNNVVVLVPKRDSSGNIIQITNLGSAKRKFSEEIQQLKNDLLQEYMDEIITEEEYESRLADISNYEIVKREYLYTDNTNPEKEAELEAKRDAEIQAARDAQSRGELKDFEANEIIREWQRWYEEEIRKIAEARIEYTYVLRGKQTEVMVPKVKPYDEIQYLIESESDARLVAQSGRENIATDYNSLKIAADFAEAKTLIGKTFDLVTKDMYNVLRQMQQRTGSVAEIADPLKTILMTPKTDESGFMEPGSKNNITAWYTEVDKLRVNMNNVYAQFLAYNYRNQEWHKLMPAERGPAVTYLKSEEQLEAWVKSPHDLWKKIKDEFTTKLIPMLNKFWTDADNVVKIPTEAQLQAGKVNYSGYQGIYDTYYKNAKKVAQDIQKNLDKLEELLKDNFATMKKMPPVVSNAYEYIDYTKRDFTHCDNRYAVYWYKYKKGEKTDDRLAPSDWVRLTTKDDFGIEKGSTEPVYNYGLPIYDEFTEIDGKYYFSAKALDTNVLAKRMMSPDPQNPTKEEKFKIILFYNHEMYESNEIVFTNADDVPDPTTVDKGDAIFIEHGENSQETYQSYGLNNYLVNAADAGKIRTVSVHYEGLLAGDEALAGTQVYWYIPNAATMLTCDDKHLTETLGFRSDKDIPEDSKPDYSKEGYTCYYKAIGSQTIKVSDDPETDDINEATEYVTAKKEDLTFTYKIKDYFLSTSSRNDIGCKIVKGEYTFETEMIFGFTTLGTSGTDYTLAVTPVTTQIAVLPDSKKPLELNITLYDYNNNPLPLSKTMMTADGATDFVMEWEGPTSYTALETEDVNGISGATLTLAKHPGENDSLIHGILKLTCNCPIKYTTATDEEGKDEFGDAAEDETTGTKQSTRNVILTAYHPVPYSSGDYYIEGPTSIVYDSMGSNPAYYKDPYKIFRANSNENIAEIMQENGKDPQYDVKWRIVYYKKNSKGEVVKLDKKTHSDYNICRNYMPTLNEKNGLNPSSMYVNDMDCWCAVECWCKDVSLAKADVNRKYSLLWVQPILILQNRYPSPMLNAWDGSLTIDKKNGTILASMIGAGKKTRQNTFEGVLMGDIEGSAGIVQAGNKSGLGLYGFNDGAQSFGFNVDGTGFIGKSGRGRILFDGNKGTIESASYTSGVKPYGMKIDFDDGSIDMRGGVEFTEQDWINYVIDRYNEVLQARKQEYDEATGQIVDTNPVTYVIDTAVMSLIMQQALMDKIQYDTENLMTMYQEAVDAYLKAYQAGAITQAEYQTALKKQTEYIDSEKTFYALTTIKTAYLEGAFEIDGKKYDFTEKQYNALMNELDQAILMETYKGEANGEGQNYKSRYGELSRALQKQVEDATTGEKYSAQSRIHVDVKAPYFYIISEEGKRLINIGDNQEFSLTSYKAGDGSTEEKPFGGKGYYLKTNNYLPSTLKFEDGKMVGDPGSGMLIDLAGTTKTGGKIDAYNFTIKGEDASEDFYGSYLKLTSSPSKGFIDAYFFDHSFSSNDKDDPYKGNHVMLLSEDDYELCSFDWYDTDTVKQGMKIDLSTGLIHAYSNANQGKQMVINANADSYACPLQIGTIGAPNFQVGWDGSLNINNGAFQVAPDGTITIGDNFKVTSAGILTAKGATLDDLTVNNYLKVLGTLSSTGTATFGGNTSVTGTITTTGAATFGGNTNITGTITTTGQATFGGNTNITGTLTSTGAATFGGNTNITGTLTSTGEATFGGNTSVTGTLTSTGEASFGGNTTVTGTLTSTGEASFGGDTSITGLLTVTGDSSISGDLSITGGLSLATTSFTIDGAAALAGTYSIEVDQPWKPGVTMTFQNGILISCGDAAGTEWEDTNHPFVTAEDFKDFKESYDEFVKEYNSFVKEYNDHTHSFSGSDSDTVYISIGKGGGSDSDTVYINISGTTGKP